MICEKQKMIYRRDAEGAERYELRGILSGFAALRLNQERFHNRNSAGGYHERSCDSAGTSTR